jgi:hypothetical protein
MGGVRADEVRIVRPSRRALRPSGDRAAYGLYAAAGLLALSVLADSALEHYRGSFKNPAMFAPLAVSTACIAAAAGSAGGRAGRSGRFAFAAAVAAGWAGLGFHLFNVAKRPGGLSSLNLFYAAPLGAPAALSLSGLMGLAADAVARGRRGLGRALAGLAAIGMAGSAAEAGWLHFRGAFQNPFMWAPVTAPPLGAALLASAACQGPVEGGRPFTRGWLGLTALLGVAGVGLHVFGVARSMGGWRNWSQNLLAGPPIPAPPAFTAMSIAGLSALALMRREGGR